MGIEHISTSVKEQSIFKKQQTFSEFCLDCWFFFLFLSFFSSRLPQFKEEAKSYVGANMKKVKTLKCWMWIWSVCYYCALFLKFYCLVFSHCHSAIFQKDITFQKYQLQPHYSYLLYIRLLNQTLQGYDSQHNKIQYNYLIIYSSLFTLKHLR